MNPRTERLESLLRQIQSRRRDASLRALHHANATGSAVRSGTDKVTPTAATAGHHSDDFRVTREMPRDQVMDSYLALKLPATAPTGADAPRVGALRAGAGVPRAERNPPRSPQPAAHHPLSPRQAADGVPHPLANSSKDSPSNDAPVNELVNKLPKSPRSVHAVPAMPVRDLAIRSQTPVPSGPVYRTESVSNDREYKGFRARIRQALSLRLPTGTRDEVS